MGIHALRGQSCLVFPDIFCLLLYPIQYLIPFVIASVPPPFHLSCVCAFALWPGNHWVYFLSVYDATAIVVLETASSNKWRFTYKRANYPKIRTSPLHTSSSANAIMDAAGSAQPRLSFSELSLPKSSLSGISPPPLSPLLLTPDGPHFKEFVSITYPNPALEGVAERYGDQSVSNVVNNKCPDTITSRFQGEVFVN